MLWCSYILSMLALTASLCVIEYFGAISYCKILITSFSSQCCGLWVAFISNLPLLSPELLILPMFFCVYFLIICFFPFHCEGIFSFIIASNFLSAHTLPQSDTFFTHQPVRSLYKYFIMLYLFPLETLYCLIIFWRWMSDHLIWYKRESI